MYETTTLKGTLVPDRIIDGQCFTSWADFVKQLPSLMHVVIPGMTTGVIVSSQQPLESQRDYLWVRRDLSGSLLGLYAYANNSWQQIWPAPNQIIRMYGDSRALPTGYILADDNNPNLSSSQGLFLKATWMPDTTGTYYLIFDVTLDRF